MNFINFDHFSFDLDGTLINSLESMEKSWSFVQKELNIQTSFSDYKKYIGLPFFEILKKLKLESQFKEIQKIYFSKSSNQLKLIKPYEDVMMFFNECKIKKKFVSIITSKPRNATEIILNTFNIKPDLLLCGDDFHFGKPDKRLMKKAQEISGIPKDKIVYFGDMISDMLFALNSEVHYIHINKNDLSKIPSNLLNAPSQLTNFQIYGDAGVKLKVK